MGWVVGLGIFLFGVIVEDVLMEGWGVVNWGWNCFGGWVFVNVVVN